MLRVLLITVTVALYAFSWHLSQKVPEQSRWENCKAQILSYGMETIDTHYQEDFINRPRKGIMSHVSTLSALPNGLMMAAWYSGSREGAKDVAIYTALYDPERGWNKPHKLVDRHSAMHDMGIYVKKLGNPVLYYDGNGRVYLFYASVSAGGWSGASLNYKITTDNGKSWTPSRKLYLSPFFNIALNVKNPPLPLDDGSFIVPVYRELVSKYSLEMRVRQTEDNAIDAELRRITFKGSAIQASLLPMNNGGILALMRNMAHEDKKHILETESPDTGLSLAALKETTLPNPNSGFDAVVGPAGRTLAVINDSFDNRSNLTLVIKDDGSDQWHRLWVFENGNGKEFSYPTLVRSTTGIYHLSYTYERKRIKHVMFDDVWLRERITDAGGS
jgi:predicted neuraminidase